MKSSVRDEHQVIVPHLQFFQVVEILKHVVQQNDNFILTNI